MGAPIAKGPLTRRAVVLLLVAAVVLGAATLHRLVFADLQGPTFEFSGDAMGTRFVVKLVAPSLTRGEYAELAAAIVERIETVNDALSTWDPDSEISRFNAHESTSAVPASGAFRTVLKAARAVGEESGGAFDITVRPLVQAWGFGDGARAPGGPTPEELAALRERVGHDRVRVGINSVAKRRGDVVVDVSAIAKGFGVDEVSRELVSRGHPRHLVEIGGELQARGQRADDTPWRVAIEEPDSEGRAVHRLLSISDTGMATSGDYRAWYEEDGVRISHTIDPRSGLPVRHGLASVTVLHPETMYADAWATALSVLGPEEGHRLASSRGLAAYFIIRAEDGTFRTSWTPAFESLAGAAVDLEP